MDAAITERLLERIENAEELYHRLVILVAPSGSGKTAVLRDVAARREVPVVGLNLELSRRLLDLTERRRSLQSPHLLEEIAAAAGDPLVLDNIEILFDVNLKLDPLRVLQGLARNRTVLAAWNGSVVSGNLTYARPDHPEFQKYPVKDLILVGPEVQS